MPRKGPKRILLIDHHDPRRDTREQLLRTAGYEVVAANRFDLAEGHVQEDMFDLVVVSVADSDAGVEAVRYSRRLRAANPALPILALSDNGLHLPRQSLITVMQSGYPFELIAEVGKMLLESTYVRNNKKLELSGAEHDYGSKLYEAGALVPVTGIYEIINHSQRCVPYEVALLSGDRFPTCEGCGKDVRFRVVRAAPYIFNDEDFAPET